MAESKINNMGFFSKKITTDKITESLVGFFDRDYVSLVTILKKDLFKNEQIFIDKEQTNELLAVPMVAITRAVIAAFGDTQKTKNILDKFQHDIFHKYFKDVEERDQFSKLFWERCREYSETLNPKDEDRLTHLGQIFCTHFFGKEGDGSHAAMIFFIAMIYPVFEIENKKFLDAIYLHYEIV